MHCLHEETREGAIHLNEEHLQDDSGSGPSALALHGEAVLQLHEGHHQRLLHLLGEASAGEGVLWGRHGT